MLGSMATWTSEPNWALRASLMRVTAPPTVETAGEVTSRVMSSSVRGSPSASTLSSMSPRRMLTVVSFSSRMLSPLVSTRMVKS